MPSQRFGRPGLTFAACILISILLGASSALFGVCGPFTDVTADAFCPFVLEVFYLGITTGTTPTTYDPTANVSRLQMAAFLSRSVDGVLRRGSRRAALHKFAMARSTQAALGLTSVGAGSSLLASDGADVWVSNFAGSTVSRVRASDGRLLETWTGATGAAGVLAEMGRILVTGITSPGSLYMIDPSQPAGPVTTVASNLGLRPVGIAFDGARVWTANSIGASVSIITPTASVPWFVMTVTSGFTSPGGALFDGANVWVTDSSRLLKLDSAGAVLLTVTVAGVGENFPVFDGTNIWVPSIGSSSVAVVRASNGALLQTLTGNGLSTPYAAAFDGERILITNQGNSSVSLWKGADLTPLGSFPAEPGSGPFGAASDGVNFWVVLSTTNKLMRF